MNHQADECKAGCRVARGVVRSRKQYPALGILLMHIDLCIVFVALGAAALSRDQSQ